MELGDLALGILTAAFVFGAYFLGLIEGQGRSLAWRGFCNSIAQSLTWQGFLWSMTLPLLGLGLYFALAVHLRTTLGHWPTAIGQNPGSWLFALHEKAAWQMAVVIAHSLYALPAVIVLSLLSKRWRHVGVYALSYGGAVVTAYRLMNLAPPSFVNWWWD